MATDTLVGLESLVLENNYFEFNDRFYRQTLSIAIGTKFAPAYANLLMTQMEERLLKESVETPIVWMRFIDDVSSSGHMAGKSLRPSSTFLTVATTPLSLQGAL